MPRKHIRTTIDRYLVQLGGSNKWKTLNVHTTQEAANAELLSYLSKEPSLKLRVVTKRVPNPDVRTAYYVCDTSPNGHRRVWAKALTVEKAETDLANYRAQFPDSANNFFVRKTVEHV